MPAEPPRAAKPIRTERLWLWRNLNPGQQFVWRNLFLNRTRAILALVGVLCCTGVLLASFSFLASLDNVLHTRFNETNQYDIAVTLKTPVAPGTPALLPFVGDVTIWPQGSSPASFQVDGVTVPTQLIGLDAGNTAIALSNQADQPRPLPPDGVLVSQLYADRYHLVVGDNLSLTLTLRGASPQTVQLRIAGVVLQYLQQDVFASFDYLQTIGVALPVSTLLLQVHPPGDVNALTAILGRQISVSQVVTKMSLANSQGLEFGVAKSFTMAALGTAVVLILSVIYISGTSGIRARQRDIGHLFGLGYRRAEVNRLVFEENYIITGCGTLLGLPAGVAMLHLLLNAVVTPTMFLPPVVTGKSVLIAMVLAFGCTVLANQLLRPQIRRIDLVESLKSGE